MFFIFVWNMVGFINKHSFTFWWVIINCVFLYCIKLIWAFKCASLSNWLYFQQFMNKKNIAGKVSTKSKRTLSICDYLLQFLLISFPSREVLQRYNTYRNWDLGGIISLNPRANSANEHSWPLRPQDPGQTGFQHAPASLCNTRHL